MRPIEFPQANLRLLPPRGQEKTVQPMPAYRTEHSVNNLNIEVITCWKLDEDELKEIRKTGVVWLRVMGGSQPPVDLSVSTPWPETEYRKKRRTPRKRKNEKN